MGIEVTSQITVASRLNYFIKLRKRKAKWCENPEADGEEWNNFDYYSIKC